MATQLPKNSKLVQFINWRVKVEIAGSRALVGTFLAFDRHLNVVLADCEEFRHLRAKGKEPAKVVKRVLGLVLLRGEHVISLSPETPPPARPKASEVPAGAGHAKPVGRGLPAAAMAAMAAPAGVAPVGLAGPVPTPMHMPPMGRGMMPPAGRGFMPPPGGM